jgi:hypothetical protein
MGLALTGRGESILPAQHCMWVPASGSLCSVAERPLGTGPERRSPTVQLRRLLAVASLATGLAGAGAVALNSSTVVGSTSDAGVVTVCFAKTMCNPGGGPIRAFPISSPIRTIK